MEVALFYHSLVSDWNHGNAHFLRGIATELLSRGHRVRIFEPFDSWSRISLEQDAGTDAIQRFHQHFPQLQSQRYQLSEADLDRLLDGVSLALVHEWNDPQLVCKIGEYRHRHPKFRAWFHDTHHRAVTAPDELARFDLRNYDGILAYGASLQEAYLRLGWGKNVRIWHEAADTRLFYPRALERKQGDLVWVGNWGDEERTEELQEFLLEPVASLGLRARVYGVRYPDHARAALASSGTDYGGWLPNFDVPEVFARYRMTVHVPRRPYVRQLPGVPTIRPFEALACGIPLISAPWDDNEGLFRVGTDFLMARDGGEMKVLTRSVINDEALARSLAANGLETIRNRHTCAHRVDELFQLIGEAAA